MSMQTAMVAIKTANAGLNALIATRFHPDMLPQEVVLPAIMFQLISRIPDHAMTPVMVNHHMRVQMDGYASTSADRTTLRSAMVSAFYGYSGSIGGESVKSILIDSERESIEQLDTEAECYRISIDFMVDMA
jgi:hypothetical protein